MIRMIQSKSEGHAKAYFSDELSRSDYYLDDQELSGRFKGKLADRLNLSPEANKDQFFALCENVHPQTGKPLTPRHKDERTTGYDINYHAPKSLSIVHALTNDDHLLKAFQDSVSETMRDIEADSMTRVRKKGQYADRRTGELVWAEFVHQTARPVEGSVPDPHLHCHAYVMNMTYDSVEKRFKAGQFRDIKRDMPYYQARFHKRLADRLQELGYEIRRTDKSFEIAGVPQRAIDLFSKRTDEIGRIAKEKGITDAKQISELGARTRSKKQKGLTMAELKAEWKRQLSELEKKEDEDTRPVRFAPQRSVPKATSKNCVDYAVKHSFERASVVADRRILEQAYRYSLGKSGASLDAVTDCFRQDDRIIEVRDKGRLVCTTKEVLAEEREMVELAKKGQGQLTPLYEHGELPELGLNNQQAVAVSHVLTTPHRVSIIRGAAGTGKTKLMGTAVSLMEKAGKKVTVLAPTAQASRIVLRDEGFAEAETLSKFLVDKDMQAKVKDQIVWLDEAGLAGTKDMKDLLKIATEQNARIILGGDTRQHSSVARGDALRILNTVGGIRTAEVSRIYRQKTKEYRSAVEDLSKGDVETAFQKLDSIGSIQTADPLKPNEDLVKDYVETIKKGKTALVISPTHQQGSDVTEAIRNELRAIKKIGKKEITAQKLSNLNLTEAEKGDWRSFHEGQVIQFNQNATGIKRGSRWRVKDTGESCITLEGDDGKTTRLSLNQRQSFDVFNEDTMGLSKGDKVRITKPAFDTENKRLNNGHALEVVSVSKSGSVILRNSVSDSIYSLDKNFGHWTHDYCVTSHASQGKTVDEVFISQPAATFAATDAKQFYVSISRGRDRARIYTDDKQALLEHAERMGDRQSALELIDKKKEHERIVERQQREMGTSPQVPNSKEIVKQPIKDQDYEPGI